MLSDHEVDLAVQAKVHAGDARYVGLLRQLTDKEAFDLRARKTAREGDRLVGGRWISPPWPDYVDLRADEIVDRMRKADAKTIEQVRLYELGAKESRDVIVNFAPRHDDPPDYATMPPSELRWAGADPGDVEYVNELERRIALLEADSPRSK